jgi:hypothetical protein
MVKHGGEPLWKNNKRKRRVMQEVLGVHPSFEGGQMLLYHQLSKLRDIARRMSVRPLNYVLVNLTNISMARFQEGFLDVFKVRRIKTLQARIENYL